MNEDEARQYKKMILTPPGRLVFTLAVPTVISMLITMVYNLVDAYFVGKINTIITCQEAGKLISCHYCVVAVIWV